MMLARQEIGCWEDQDLNDWSNKQCHIMNETVNRWSTLWTVYFLSFFCRAGKLLQFVWNCSWWHETARLVVVVHIQYSDIYIQWHVSCVLFIPAQQLWLCIRCCSRWLLQQSPDYFSDYLQVDSWEILCWKLCHVFKFSVRLKSVQVQWLKAFQLYSNVRSLWLCDVSAEENI